MYSSLLPQKDKTSTTPPLHVFGLSVLPWFRGAQFYTGLDEQNILGGPALAETVQNEPTLTFTEPGRHRQVASPGQPQGHVAPNPRHQGGWGGLGQC